MDFKMTRPRCILTAILAILFIVVLETPQVLSACCNAGSGGSCADGTTSTPCCGFRSCNIFCCACKGGCRTAPELPRLQRSLDMGAQEAGHFERFDINGDEHLDVHESYNMFVSGGCGGNFTGTVFDFKPIFSKFDKDGNGKISWTEVNVMY